jgi:hypothetical protein
MWEAAKFNRGGNWGNQPSGGGGGSNNNKKKSGPRMRMKRIQAQLVANNGWGVAATIIPTRLILNDLGPQSVTLFAVSPLELGQLVSLSIEHPRPLLVRGKVTYCAMFDLNSRIHSAPRYQYRLQIEFEFLNDGEAEAVREYVAELVRTDLTKAA